MADNTLPLFADAGKFYVYVYRDPRPKKKGCPIYVGKGTAKHRRADQHKHGTQHPHNPLFGRILAKIRGLKLEPIVEIVAWYDIETDAFEYEKNLIAAFGRRDLGMGTLCNLTDGGEGASGSVFTPERCRKISDALTGRKQSEEQRLAQSERMKKYMADPANRIAVAMATKKVMEDPENRARISRTLKSKEVTPEILANLEKAREVRKGQPIPEEQKQRQIATFKKNYIFKAKGPKSPEEIARRQATRAKNRADHGLDRY
jgi:hypothetical protein